MYNKNLIFVILIISHKVENKYDYLVTEFGKRLSFYS
jgi:hypothetical protein